MPVVLILAFAASLGMHALVLFGPDIDLSTASEPPPLLAELMPPPATEPLPEAPQKRAATAARSRTAKRKPPPPATRPPIPSVPDSPASIPEAESGPPTESAADGLDRLPPAAPPGASERSAQTELVTPAAAWRLPTRGMIRYRVDRGGQGFEIGRSTHDWDVTDGAYRITAVTETSGLVALFKPLRIELESRGRLTAAGLVPERFVTRRKGIETAEQADFDWTQMQVRVGKRAPQTLNAGAQDLLSFHYQLGLLPELASGTVVPIATGKKYEQYRIEVVGDEDLQTPAGRFRCLHLRVPGVATTELWLAYDRSLLPVKIQHVDRDGAIYVQTATVIETVITPNQEP